MTVAHSATFRTPLDQWISSSSPYVYMYAYVYAAVNSDSVGADRAALTGEGVGLRFGA